jgi:hypothetical protein
METPTMTPPLVVANWKMNPDNLEYHYRLNLEKVKPDLLLHQILLPLALKHHHHHRDHVRC